jgi:ABC-type amino acid transport substrate-binding protein
MPSSFFSLSKRLPTAAVGRRRALAVLLPLLLAGSLAQAQTELTGLAKIQAGGALKVAVYKDNAPFSSGPVSAMKGLDVDIATALAKQMRLTLALLPFDAGENMNDDLRNMVWRGHYLGYGPADVMLHVPVDRPLMQGNPRVEIFAPYFRERIVIARDLTQVPQMNSLDAFAGKRIAVPGQTLAGWLLIGAESGRYRDQLDTRLKDGTEAAAMLLRGEVAAAAGNSSELESVLAGNPRYAIEPLPLPRMREGWAVGLAVKSENTDLAQALQAAMNGLQASGELARIFERGKVSWRPS